MDNIEKYIDHTILNPDAAKSDVSRICQEAKQYGFASVCVNSYYASFASKELKGSDVKLACTVSFPFGATTAAVKSAEAAEAIKNGADEIDMVMNIAAMKNKDYDTVYNDINSVVKVCSGKALVKVILETCLLTDQEKVKACEIAKSAGADFVKTSTGYSKSGAKVDDVKLMRQTVGNGMGVKASGGIKDYKTAVDMINAGASRLGCSSSIKIADEAKMDK